MLNCVQGTAVLTMIERRGIIFNVCCGDDLSTSVRDSRYNRRLKFNSGLENLTSALDRSVSRIGREVK